MGLLMLFRPDSGLIRGTLVKRQMSHLQSCKDMRSSTFQLHSFFPLRQEMF
jgi:hypothetical protein